MSKEAQQARMRAIFEEVALVRAHQIEDKNYTPEHDNWQTPRDMVRYANWRFTHTKRPTSEWFNRESFIEAIAVLVAAVEAMDRREQRRASDDQRSGAGDP